MRRLVWMLGMLAACGGTAEAPSAPAEEPEAEEVEEALPPQTFAEGITIICAAACPDCDQVPDDQKQEHMLELMRKTVRNEQAKAALEHMISLPPNDRSAYLATQVEEAGVDGCMLAGLKPGGGYTEEADAERTDPDAPVVGPDGEPGSHGGPPDGDGGPDGDGAPDGDGEAAPADEAAAE